MCSKSFQMIGDISSTVALTYEVDKAGKGPPERLPNPKPVCFVVYYVLVKLQDRRSKTGLPRTEGNSIRLLRQASETYNNMA